MSKGTVKDRQEIQITVGATPFESKVMLNGHKVSMVTRVEVSLSAADYPAVKINLVPDMLAMILKKCDVTLEEDKPAVPYADCPFCGVRNYFNGQGCRHLVAAESKTDSNEVMAFHFKDDGADLTVVVAAKQ